MKHITLQPKVPSFFESLRDTGYTLETAMADIIDNSITAKATSIEILTELKPDYTVGILDNGEGMGKKEFYEAMTFASKDPRDLRDASDLGRFGLGLKMASLSVCTKLTVVSKKGDEITAGIWDRDYIDKTKDWNMLIPDDPRTIQHAEKIKDTGTLVLWENLTVLEHSGQSNLANVEFNHLVAESRSHLELIFHRFLTGEDALTKCSMSINNLPLEAFDPFHTKSNATQVSAEEKIDGNVSFQVYTLPHHNMVSRTDWEYYGGREGYLRNQGLYIYREKRLIDYGDWHRMARQTELNKLTRVKIDITNKVDAEWKIPLNKSNAHPPKSVRDRLLTVIHHIGGASRRIYTRRGTKLTSEALSPAWTRVKEGEQIRYEINTDNPIITRLTEKLPVEIKNNLSEIFRFVAQSFPVDALFADFGNNPNEVDSNPDKSELETWVKEYFEYLTETRSQSRENSLAMMKTIPPFRENWEETSKILGEKD